MAAGEFVLAISWRLESRRSTFEKATVVVPFPSAVRTTVTSAPDPDAPGPGPSSVSATDVIVPPPSLPGKKNVLLPALARKGPSSATVATKTSGANVRSNWNA